MLLVASMFEINNMELTNKESVEQNVHVPHGWKTTRFENQLKKPNT